MRTRRLLPRLAHAAVTVSDAVYLANVYGGGVRNWRNPVMPALPLHCEHRAYTAGRAWLVSIWRAIYAVF
jgi:hypothetical protein